MVYVSESSQQMQNYSGAFAEYKLLDLTGFH